MIHLVHYNQETHFMVVEQKRLSYIQRLQRETKSNIMMSLPCTPMLTNWQNTFGTPRDHSRKFRGFNEM
jgi:hypothetical protein